MYKLVINIFLFLVLVIMSVSLYRVLISSHQEDLEVEKLNSLVSNQEDINKKLQKDKNFYSSEEYTESFLRERLNLAKNGERLIVLPEADLMNTSRLLHPKIVNNNPNYIKWFNVIFL